MKLRAIIRKPSAFTPMVMSLAALTIVLLRIALVGTAPEPDEGTAAHIWQLLMAFQLPLIAMFVIRWVPRTPSRGLLVLGLQVAAALAALAPVFILHW
jgi:hypothetical protein